VGGAEVRGGKGRSAELRKLPIPGRESLQGGERGEAAMGIAGDESVESGEEF